MKLNKMIILLVSILFFAAAAPAVGTAQEATQENWQFDAAVYLWGASIGGKSSSGSDLDIDFDDLFDNLKMAFMGSVGARKEKWSLMADVIYLDVEDDTHVGSGVKLSAEMTGWIVTPSVGYNLINSEKARFDILGGARYLFLKADLGLGNENVADSDSVWDGIVGVKGHVNLGKNWYLPYYGDIGTGNSNYTWQAFGGVGYRFRKVDVVAAYRYLNYDFDDGAVFDDLNFHGPFIGVKYKF
jgi:opacity protein-like surface antigen